MGQDPFELQQRWTHRQYLVAEAWLRQQWNNPSRTDNYLMQLTAVVQRLLAKNPKAIKVEHYHLKFDFSNKRPAAQTTSDRSALAKSIWLARVDPKGKFGLNEQHKQQLKQKRDRQERLQDSPAPGELG